MFHYSLAQNIVNMFVISVKIQENVCHNVNPSFKIPIILFHGENLYGILKKIKKKKKPW